MLKVFLFSATLAVVAALVATGVAAATKRDWRYVMRVTAGAFAVGAFVAGVLSAIFYLF